MHKTTLSALSATAILALSPLVSSAGDYRQVCGGECGYAMIQTVKVISGGDDDDDDVKAEIGCVEINQAVCDTADKISGSQASTENGDVFSCMTDSREQVSAALAGLNYRLQAKVIAEKSERRDWNSGQGPGGYDSLKCKVVAVFQGDEG